jgi:hypothetical protein
MAICLDLTRLNSSRHLAKYDPNPPYQLHLRVVKIPGIFCSPRSRPVIKMTGKPPFVPLQPSAIINSIRSSLQSPTRIILAFISMKLYCPPLAHRYLLQGEAGLALKKKVPRFPALPLPLKARLSSIAIIVARLATANPRTSSGIKFHLHPVIRCTCSLMLLFSVGSANGRVNTCLYQFSGVHLSSGYGRPELATATEIEMV